MNYTLFLDESGDHGLSNMNSDFPVFLLCGILLKEEDYEGIRQSINQLKESIWGDKTVIFHSRDIRKCEKEFVRLFDLEIKQQFYEGINQIVSNAPYTILASVIQKANYIESFGKLQNDVYEVALSFVIEQAVLVLQDIDDDPQLSIIIEKRGQKEDKRLDDHFQRLLARGTGKLTAKQLQSVNPTFTFKNKRENINGLQLADLIAYPLARYVIEPERANPSFDVLEPKIYRKDGNLAGLRIYP